MAYGDQCEKCGSSLSPTELINPKSMLSGNAPVLKYTKHWFLEMDKHGEWLKKWINEGILDGQEHHDSENWKNHVLGQCNSWIDTGLLPRAMTRQDRAPFSALPNGIYSEEGRHSASVCAVLTNGRPANGFRATARRSTAGSSVSAVR